MMMYSIQPAARPVLEARNLKVSLDTERGLLEAVSGVDISVSAGETLCLVGESGCGKTMTALGLMRLLPRLTKLTADRLELESNDILGLRESEMARLRGNRIAMIFQDPMTSLNPVYTIGNQLEEVYLHHRLGGRAEARERAGYLLDRVGISAPGMRLQQYPHQLSGGLRQRMMIAMALMCDPSVLIADEPTTALDVTVQAEILNLFQDLQEEFKVGIVLITHDMGVVRQTGDRVAVMYGGRIVEQGAVDEVFGAPTHPYTRGLLASIPRPGARSGKERLGSIPGVVPSLIERQVGCAFKSRCPHTREACGVGEISWRALGDDRGFRCILEPDEMVREAPPPATVTSLHPVRAEARPVLSMRGVERSFEVPGSTFLQKRVLRAVQDVDLELNAGEVLAIVGESGSGKTTLGRMMLNLLEPSSGEVLLDGRPLGNGGDRKKLARRIQPVFQDPFSSLNARKTVGEIIGMPLSVHGIGTRAERRRKIADLMERVGLSASMIHAYPVHLSGGQRQRVALARALVMNPEIVVCDEPTSALDVSVQAQILNLLADLKDDLGLAYLFISHNLAVVEFLADRIGVMYLGRLVELGTTDQVLARPRHPYTEALIRSVPQVTDTAQRAPRLGGQFPDPLDPPSGCPFHPRCPVAIDRCATTPPPTIRDAVGMVECHLQEPSTADPTTAKAANQKTTSVHVKTQGGNYA